MEVSLRRSEIVQGLSVIRLGSLRHPAAERPTAETSTAGRDTPRLSEGLEAMEIPAEDNTAGMDL